MCYHKFPKLEDGMLDLLFVWRKKNSYWIIPFMSRKQSGKILSSPLDVHVSWGGLGVYRKL
jgi:hypothetical protein